jgi:hypothetical protein
LLLESDRNVAAEKSALEKLEAVSSGRFDRIYP